MKVRPYRWIVLFLILLASLCFPAISFSEKEVRIGGIPFIVEELIEIDDTSLKIRMFGESRIIPRENLQGLILRSYLSSKERIARFRIEELEQLIFFCLKSTQKELQEACSTEALWALLHHEDASSKTLSKFFLKLENESGRHKLITDFLQQKGELLACDEKILATLLSLADFSKASLPFPSFSSSFEEELYTVFYQKILKLLEVENIVSANKIIDSAVHLLGTQKAQSLSQAVTIIEEVITHAHEGDTSKIISMVDSFNGDPKVLKLLSEYQIKTIHRRAKKHITANRFFDALLTLSDTPFKKRTPTTHELIIEALQGYKPQEREPFSKLKIYQMLEAIQEHDPRIQKAHTIALQAQYNYFLRTLQFQRAYSFLRIIDKVHPEAIEEQDRVELVLSLFHQNQDRLSSAVLAKIKPLSLRARARLFFAGYYLPSSFIFGFFLLFVVSICILLLRSNIVSRLMPLRDKSQRDYREQGDESSQSSQNSGSKDTLFKAPGSERREYERLLNTFYLPPTATLKQIKSAYRQSVKDLHPDSGTESSQDTEKFIALRQTYERILELHDRHKQ